MQHDTAIGIPPGKWSRCGDPPADRKIVVNPARVSCFHRNGIGSGQNKRCFSLIIIKLQLIRLWHAFCKLGIIQKQPENPTMHQPCFPRRQSGFTLIEIAIVLVIIGLLLGGILKGQELINSARVKNLGTDFRNVPLFIYGYQDKFRTLPGDDPLVANHVGGTPATTPANKQGNGVIDGDWNSPTQTDESYLFWQHVRLAGLAPGITTAGTGYLPTNASGGTIGIQSGTTDTAKTPVKGADNKAIGGAYVICSTSILGKFVIQLDIQMDDGNTAAGSMMAALTDTYAIGAAAVATAAIDPAKTYTVCMGV
ncbi:prepilin-type N-terminal cleavage/methylation domain-containing protein [Thiobacillus sp.]